MLFVQAADRDEFVGQQFLVPSVSLEQNFEVVLPDGPDRGLGGELVVYLLADPGELIHPKLKLRYFFRRGDRVLFYLQLNLGVVQTRRSESIRFWDNCFFLNCLWAWGHLQQGTFNVVGNELAEVDWLRLCGGPVGEKGRVVLALRGDLRKLKQRSLRVEHGRRAIIESADYSVVDAVFAGLKALLVQTCFAGSVAVRLNFQVGFNLQC